MRCVYILAPLMKKYIKKADVILKRIARGKEEADIIDKYDYLVINDDLEECAMDLHNTIQSARNASFLRGDFINELKQEFDVFLKNN